MRKLAVKGGEDPRIEANKDFVKAEFNWVSDRCIQENWILITIKNGLKR